MKKILCSLLTGIMLISALSVSISANFSDVKQEDWYYETVTEMTDMGLFKGKGDNLFCPNDTMTKAEFLAVTMRIICPDANLKAENTLAWWQPAYNLAKQAEIIDETIFPIDSMENVIIRQEMAYISSMAFFAQKDGNPDDAQYKEDILLATQVSLSAHNSQQYGFDLRNTIPDYDEIGNDYKGYAVIAYATGLLGGVDDTGRFAPTNTLTRAEGATVLHRLIRKDKRLIKSASNDKQTETPETQTQGAITIQEGQESERRFAKEGDIVIKADGTKVTLKKGAHGILGEGQGVAPDLGVINEGFTVTAKNITGGSFAGGSGFYDSTGFVIKNQNYFINELTGEGHWSVEWEVMTSAPKTSGTFDFQLSSDKNWIWNADTGEWSCAYIQNFSDQVIQIINQANGL